MIDVRVAGETSLVTGSGTTSGWMIRHQTNTASAVSNAEVLFTTGTLDDVAGLGASRTLVGPSVALNLFSASFGGPVTVGATGSGGMLVTGAILGSTANALTLLSTHDLVFTSPVDSTNGSVNLSAGWDGSTGASGTPGVGPLFGFAAIQADPAAYGRNAGTIRIGDGSQTIPVSVGSLLGTTNVAAYALVVEASTVNAAGVAQLGYRSAVNGSGTFDVRLLSHMHVINRGMVSSAQIGHGLQTGTGDIFVTSAFDLGLPFAFGALAAHDVQAYASVQNGSGNGAGTGGAVTLVSGWDGSTGISGALPVDFTAISANAASYGNGEGSVFIAPLSTLAAAVGSRFEATNVAGANVSLTGSTTFGGAFALLGFRMDPSGEQTDADGAINVRAQGDVTLTAGSLTTTHAHVGHGGRGVLPSTDVDGDWSGDITITAGGDMVLTGKGPAANVQVGHGGENARGDFSGTITVTAHDVMVTAGGGSAYAQLGHGGLGALGNTNGALSVTARGNVGVAGGTSTFAYAQIGNGGGLRTGNHSGTITLQVTGDLSLRAGLGSSSTTYAQVGNGGGSSNGNHGGDIAVDVGGSLLLSGAPSFSASSSFAMIGHGAGFLSGSGTRAGKVDVSVAGESSLVNGGSSFSPWRIGHYTTTASAISDAAMRFSTGTFDDSASTVASNGSFNSDFNTKMIANLAGGPVTISVTGTDGTNGSLVIPSSWSSNSTNRLTFVSTRDITVSAPIFANGTGGLEIVADAANAMRPDMNVDAKFVNTSSISAAGGVRVFAASPFTSTLGSLSGAARRYDVWYGESAAVTGVNFKLSPVVTLTGNNATRLYGENNPSFTYTVSGLVPGDNLARAVTSVPNPTTIADPASPVGSYVIDLHGGLTANSGYTLVINDATLTVEATPLTITADDLVRTFGVPFSFVGTEFISVGLKNGETIGQVSLSSPGADLSAPAQALPYVINVSNPTGGSFDVGNYSVGFVPGRLLVLPDQRRLTGSFGCDFGPFGGEWQEWSPDPLHEGTIGGFEFQPPLLPAGQRPLLWKSSFDTTEDEDSSE